MTETGWCFVHSNFGFGHFLWFGICDLDFSLIPSTNPKGKSQALNIKFQGNPKHQWGEIPSTKHQIPNKSQASNLNAPNGSTFWSFEFRIWFLFVIWHLWFGVFSSFDCPRSPLSILPRLGHSNFGFDICLWFGICDLVLFPALIDPDPHFPPYHVSVIWLSNLVFVCDLRFEIWNFPHALFSISFLYEVHGSLLTGDHTKSPPRREGQPDEYEKMMVS